MSFSVEPIAPAAAEGPGVAVSEYDGGLVTASFTVEPIAPEAVEGPGVAVNEWRTGTGDAS